MRAGRGCLGVALTAALLLATATDASAQAHWRDLVVTLGGSVERYSGNFSAITQPVVDSADHSTAAVGEVGVRGSVALLAGQRSSVDVGFDGGVRQSAATGFFLRDYAPREWAGSMSLAARRSMGSAGMLRVLGSLQTRSVHDRPPMPLFLQPGYTIAWGALGFVAGPFDGVQLDVQVDTESADYRALEFLPQLDLLDRSGTGLEAGARWGASPSSVRFYGGVRWTDYERQSTSDPDDPFRRDMTVRAGLDWSYFGRTLAQLGLVGTVSRSNSPRPEYDAISVSGLVTTPLPGEMTLNLYALLTAKSYVNETDFVRLVPGEEADNASIAYVQVQRALAYDLDGAVRFGWTRAETDFADAYYQRFGLSFRLEYRPRG